LFLKDVQESLQGSRVLDVSNGNKLCSELLNCSTVLEQPKRGHRAAGMSLNHPSQTSNVVAAGRKKIRRKRLSKVELSGISRLLCPTVVDTKEMSGYDGDIEKEAIVGKVDKNSLTPQELGKITFFTPLFYALDLILYEASPELTPSWYVVCNFVVWNLTCNLHLYINYVTYMCNCSIFSNYIIICVIVV